MFLTSDWTALVTTMCDGACGFLQPHRCGEVFT
jgi:hypothetical protein